MNAPRVYLAPLEGYADCLYRSVYCRHFGQVDKVFAPFITTRQLKNGRGYRLDDILPENNPVMRPVPQILSREPDAFLLLAGYMGDLGYQEINWNLGCPYPMAVKKRRGAGLLPFPDEVDALLNRVCRASGFSISVKVRLGHTDPEDLAHLVPVFNRYPLAEIIIHPRTGVRMYGGTPDRERFAAALTALRVPVVYNGDIVTVQGFRELAGRLTGTAAWMVGRGALADPFLPGMIKGKTPPGPAERTAVLRRFHDDLYEGYRRVLSGPGHLLDRMKCLWEFLGAGLEGRERVVKKLRKTRHPDEYRLLVDKLLG